MVTCARARLRALPPRAEFLYDADHPATSWLLWGRPPCAPAASADPASASAATRAVAAAAAGGGGGGGGSGGSGGGGGDGGDAPGGPVRSAAVGSSNAIRGILHHTVSFEPPPEGSTGAPGEDYSLSGDTLFVCHYEMPLTAGSTERLSLGYAFGGVTNTNGVVAECDAPQLDIELANMLEHDPNLPSAELDHPQGSNFPCLWPEDETYHADLGGGTAPLGHHTHELPRLQDDHLDPVCYSLAVEPHEQVIDCSAHDMKPLYSRSRSLLSLSSFRCPSPASPTPCASPSRPSSPVPQPHHVPPPVPASPGLSCVFPRDQAVPQGRRFAAMLLHNLIYIISVVRVGAHIVMIDLYHVNHDPLAVDIEGRHCNNSIHIMYDPTGMVFGCLSESTQCISETLTFLEEVCALCNIPKAQCPCQSEQIVCANCTSFADLSSRLRRGSSWRQMNCERVSLRRSAVEGQQMRRMRTSVWLENVDGLSMHPRTAEMRRRFFNFNGMLLSSPLLVQPSLIESKGEDSSGQGDARGTSSSGQETTQDVNLTQYTCPNCPKVFLRKAGLQRHKRTVHGPRRHECNQCGAKFQQGAHLKTHQVLVHAKSLNFSCDHCGMRFPLRSRLNTHLKNKHGIHMKAK